ncbi:MAG: MFS transporter [Candidatus Nanopelagicaceae bacterium]|nr:MFS transporter [Candidatus Nanopelagicaceae bacterium]
MHVKENGNWRSFRHRNFRILFAANTISNIGSWAQRIAQDWLILELTNNNGSALGLVTALQFTPVLFFSLHGGALADRFDKRKVLVFTNVGGGLSAGILGTLVVIHQVRLWHVFVLAFLLGVANAVDNPVRASFITEVVGHPDVGNAVSLNSANFNAGRLIGPALSGASIAVFGTGPSFLLNSGSYLIVITALLTLRKSEFFFMPRSTGMGSVREGIRYVKARPDLYAIMIVVFFMATFGLNFQIFNALAATKIFHRGAASFGLLGTIIAIGSLSGALLSARLERFRKTMFVVYGSLCFGVALMILALMPTFTLYALWLPICGFAALSTMIAANSLMQVNTDPVLRGRVMGIYLFVFMGGTPVGAPLVGFMAERVGVRPTIASGGLITVLAGLFVWKRYRHRVEAPVDFSIDVVLPPIYDDKG